MSKQTVMQLAISGDISGALAKHADVALFAMTAGVKRATFGLRRELRRQIDRAGFRASFSKAIRGGVNRAGSTNPEGRVFSKATSNKRPGGLVDLAAVFDADTMISAAGSKWLAIPTDAAERRPIGRGNLPGDRKPVPKDYPGLVFERTRGKAGLALLITPRGNRYGEKPGTVYFVLVKNVRLKKRLDIQSASNKWLAKTDDYIVSVYDREARKAGIL